MGRADAWLRRANFRRGNGIAEAVAKATAIAGRQRRQDQAQMPARVRHRRSSQLGFVADHSASPSQSMLQSMLTLYGMLTLMLGLVIPVSDALAKPVEHADYRQIFYVFMHGVAALSIVYLDAMIAYHKSDPALSVARQLSTVQEEARNDSPSPPPPPLPPPPSSEIELAARASPQYGGSGSGSGSGSGDDDSREPPATHQAEALLLPMPASPATSAADDAGAFPADSGGGCSSACPAAGVPEHRRSFVAGLRQKLLGARESLGRRFDEMKKKRDGTKITWSAAGVNIYLRLGSVVFGFGIMVHDGFKIVDVLEKPGSAECAGPWFLPKQIVHLIFIVCQTYYLFKHHRVTINTRKSLVRFILVHLMVTNLCIWSKTVIYEIKLSIMHSAAASSAHDPNSSKHFVDQKHHNITGPHRNGSTYAAASCSGSQLPEEDSPSHKLGPYLYPCAVEYGLICAAICYKLFTRVGDTEAVPFGRKESPDGPRATTCHKSHKGLFLGLFIMICVLVPTISLIFLQRADAASSHRDQHAVAVIAVECLVLLGTAGMALLGTAKAVRQLRLYKLHGSEAFDVNLLFVGLAGIVCYNLFVTVSVGSCLMDGNAGGNGHCHWGSQSQVSIAKLTGLKSLLEVTQSVAQTLFVMQAIQRKVTLRLAEGLQKPGRGITIALLIANLAMWVASVFESQREIADHFLFNYFGSMPWSIIKYIFLPLIIFYRFHSTVCLSEIWIQSYKLPKKQHLMQSP